MQRITKHALLRLPLSILEAVLTIMKYPCSVAMDKMLHAGVS